MHRFVLRLSRATVEVLRDVGYHELTLQMVAARAGVARATVYTYFSSKEHLVAELYWRRLATEASSVDDSSDVTVRVIGLLRELALIVADEPELASAITVVMLSADPDVEQLRVRIGRHIHGLLTAAVGADGDRETVQLLDLVYTGAMVRAGVANVSYTDIAGQLEAAARRILV